MSAGRGRECRVGVPPPATRLSPARRRCTGKLYSPNCFTIKPVVVYFPSGVKKCKYLVCSTFNAKRISCAQ